MRGIASDPLCLFCNKDRETVKHILWDCPSAKDIWGACGCGRKIQKNTDEDTMFVEVIKNMIDQCIKEEVELHAEIARRIWFRGKTLVHGWDFSHPNVLIQTTYNSLEAYRKVMAKDKPLGDNTKGAGPIRWRPPPTGVYKIN
jgi:hypothetical protein